MTPSQVFGFFRFMAILVREIVLSSITVAKIVLGPLDGLRSGFLAVPLDAESDLEITALANAITLTPGTITVHVDVQQRTLIVHAIDIGQSPDDVRASIKSVLEANILRWTRPSGSKVVS